METKAFKVKAEGKDVGTVNVPIFDEKDPKNGIKEIMAYDWTSAGYTDFNQAIVQLVNTQHGTNLRNALRQKNSGKVTGAMIDAKAMARISTEEFQGVLGDAVKFAALMERKRNEVKAEIEAEKAKGKNAAEAAGTAAEEAADATDENDTEEVSGGVATTAPAVTG